MRQALLSLDGVVSATVSYEDKRADVTYETAQVAVGALIQAVDDAGFKATVIEPE